MGLTEIKAVKTDRTMRRVWNIPCHSPVTQSRRGIREHSLLVSSGSRLRGTFLFRGEVGTDCCLTRPAFTGNLPSQILNLDYKTYQVKVIGPACYGLELESSRFGSCQEREWNTQTGGERRGEQFVPTLHVNVDGRLIL